MESRNKNAFGLPRVLLLLAFFLFMAGMMIPGMKGTLNASADDSGTVGGVNWLITEEKVLEIGDQENPETEPFL